MLKNKRR